MRGFLLTLGTCIVIGLGYWAYHENIETKATIREIDRLHSQIGTERERLEILRDEWAYLTRPDRLRELADLDFERLQLMPMSPGQFVRANQIPRPPGPAEITAMQAEILLYGSASGPEIRP